MGDGSCFLCNFNKPEVVLYDGEYWRSLIERFPVSPGHCLVFPRRHVADLNLLTGDEWHELQGVIEETIKQLLKQDLKRVYQNYFDDPVDEISKWFCGQALKHPRINTQPDGYNHGVNDGRAAGRTVDHLHWHIIPRYEGDMDDPRGGVRHVIPEMGNYKIPRK